MPPVNSPGQRPRALVAAISLALAASGAHAATFSVTSSDDAGPGTLRQAIVDANSQAGPHVIEMSAISGDTIALKSDLPHIYGEDVELQGSQVTLAGNITPFGTNKYGCLGVEHAALTVSDINITGCDGPGIHSYASDLQVSGSTITGNSSELGGGIYAFDSTLTISDTTISDNSAAYAGGGIYAAGNLTISDSAISDNSADEYGGGILFVDGDLTISDSTISGNSAAYEGGGGVYARAFGAGASAHIERTVVAGNDANRTGGLSIMDFETARLIDSRVSDNTATYYMGGINFFIEGGNAQLTISGSTLSGNSAVSWAGAGAVAIASYTGSGQATIRNTTVSGNSGGYLGGLNVAMYGSGNEAILIDGVTVTNNDGDGTGGLNVWSYTGGSAGFEIRNSIIAGNTSSGGDEDLGMSYGSVDVDVNHTLLGAPPSTSDFILDAVSQTLEGKDPVLGPLGDNGGPTPTHLPGSSGAGVDVIPSGASGCGGDFDIDQRGEPRPGSESSGCDLGSVELQNDPVEDEIFQDRFEEAESL